MASSFNRPLSQSLASKKGGNVGHTNERIEKNKKNNTLAPRATLPLSLTTTHTSQSTHLSTYKNNSLSKTNLSVKPNESNHYCQINNSAYYGTFGTCDEGVCIEDGFIKCKFGVTSRVPCKRDSDSLYINRKFHRDFSVYINEEGCRINRSKYDVEWKIKDAIDELLLTKKDFEWITHEEFKCSVSIEMKIREVIWNTMKIYETSKFIL
jgi:hypothetical protein